MSAQPSTGTVSTSNIPAPPAWKASLKAHTPASLWNSASSAYHKTQRFFQLVHFYRLKTRWGVECVRNFAIDWKYGGSCGGTIPTKFAEIGAQGFTSADYYQLDKLFGPGGVQIRPDDVLVDVGCGKGRVINHWLRSGYRNKIYGLEIDPEIADFAAKRLRKFDNVRVVPGDAIANLPEETTLIFLFNPFKPVMIEQFKNEAKRRFRGKQGFRILYFYSKWSYVYREDPELEVQDLRLNTFYPAVLITIKPQAATAAT